jgi:hypothetical protein
MIALQLYGQRFAKPNFKFASQLRRRIVKEVKENAVFFSIMVDETMDLSKKEQVSFCIRYVDDNSYEINEVFLGFFDTPSDHPKHSSTLFALLFAATVLMKIIWLGKPMTEHPRCQVARRASQLDFLR